MELRLFLLYPRRVVPPLLFSVFSTNTMELRLVFNLPAAVGLLVLGLTASGVGGRFNRSPNVVLGNDDDELMNEITVM